MTTNPSLAFHIACVSVYREWSVKAKISKSESNRSNKDLVYQVVSP